MQIVIFSDLDGCLLNKSDYRFDAALPVLTRVKTAGIPLILASSKTEAEMRRIAEEMQLEDAPLICENGGAVFWSRTSSDSEPLILGTSRTRILELLRGLKKEFAFRSFEDLGVEGVAQATDLAADRAAQALARSSTEPLLWDDSPERMESFAHLLREENLTLTKGGRFWHIAGQTTKGAAMQAVWDKMQEDLGQNLISLAIGDSPIDQSMLNIASYPIGIPQPDGVVHVQVNAHNGIIAAQPGARGWAESVNQVIDRIENS